jgi:hypothetical protein
MMKSKRRIKEVEIIGKSCRKKFSKLFNLRLAEVIKHFGNNVNVFTISDVKLSHNFMKILNYMPNLKKITVDDVKVSKSLKVIDLELQKLTEIAITTDNTEVLDIFSELPEDILLKVEIVCQNTTRFIDAKKMFKNQENIRELVAPEHIIRRMDIKNMNLLSLTLGNVHYDDGLIILDGIIDGKVEMTTLNLPSLSHQSNLSLICTELKALKSLKICVSECQRCDFSDLSKLQNLNKLEILWDEEYVGIFNECANTSFSLMASESLTSLKIISTRIKFSDETIKTIGINCPKLKNFHLKSASQLDVVNTIIKEFANLESLTIMMTEHGEVYNYTFEENLSNQRLNQLTIDGSSKIKSRSFSKLIKCCSNLEDLCISFPLNAHFLMKILVAQPNLKAFTVTEGFCYSTTSCHQISLAFVENLKKYGKNLEYFRCDFFNYENRITEGLLRDAFESQFKLIEFGVTESDNKFSYILNEWMMKKNN